MAITRIKNNQITDATIVASAKLVDYSITAAKLANSLTYGSDFTISGNLTVNGTTTTLDTVNTVIEDPILLLAKNQTGTAALDIGFIGERGDDTNVAFVWDESADEFITAFTSTAESNTTLTVSSYASLKAGNLDSQGTLSVTGNANVGNLGTAGLIVATGNIDGGNLNTGGVVLATGNITGGNINTAGQVVATANITGGNLITAGLTSTATLTASGNANVGNLGTGGLIVATGNITGGNLITGGLASVTGNITGGNLITGGLASVTGNITGGNLITGGVVTATGNITGGNLTTTGTGSIGELSVTGNAVVGGDLTVNGNLAYVNVTTLAVEDPILGLGRGANDAPLTSDDGKDRGIQHWYFSGTEKSAFTGYDNSAGKIILATDISITSEVVTVNSYGNVVVGGVEGATASFTGNVDAGNLSTGGALAVTGNITGGNLNTAGQVVATGNVTGGNLNTAGLVSATGNVTGGNINTAGQVVATGNITGGNLSATNLSLSGNVLTALNVTGNVTSGNLTSLGTTNLGNIQIAGNDITGTNGIVTFNDASADIDFRFEGNGDANLLVLDGGTDTVNIGTATAVTGAKLQIAATDSVLMPVGNTAQRPGTGVVGMLRFNTASDSFEAYTSGGWEAVGVPAFTVIASETFNGDGSTVAFTLSSAQTTASCIVSINGVLQLPTTAYSVSSTTLTFTEAPLSGDVIEVREVTTTTTVTNIENTGATARVETLDSQANVEITGNLLPAANVTYDLGAADKRWNQLFLAGGTITLGNCVLKNTTGNSIGFFGLDGTTPATIDAASVDTTTIASGTSNVKVVSSGGDVTVSIAGTGNVLVAKSTGVDVTGTFSSTGNANVGNLGAASVVATNLTGTLQTAAQTNITSVGTLGSLTVTGNVSAGNLSGTSIVGTLTTAAQTNITSVGTLGSLAVTGNITAGNVSATLFTGTATQARYADLAENYVADAAYEPGTVLVFGGDQEVTVSTSNNDKRVAGVVSTDPAHLMNSACEGEHVAAVALTGRVPCKVIGPVKKGDLMVSAPNGRAISNNDAAAGTIIGKSLENFDGLEGVIEVVIGRF